MAHFTPCQGKTACRDNGSRCLTCGRDFDEILWLRDLMDQLANLAIEHDYENVDEYAAYVARKLQKMLAHRHQEQQTHAEVD